MKVLKLVCKWRKEVRKVRGGLQAKRAPPVHDNKTDDTNYAKTITRVGDEIGIAYHILFSATSCDEQWPKFHGSMVVKISIVLTVCI